MADALPSYRDAGGVAIWARWLLYGHALLALGSAVLLWMSQDDYSSSFAPVAAVVALAQLAVFLATAVAVLRWLYLANANARALGADDLMGSPAMAVGWFFVPLLNLAMPYMTVRDTWKASANPKDWQIQPAPAMIGLWWACWLLSGISGILAFRIGLEFSKEAGGAADFLNVLSALFSIPAAFLLAWIIGRIQHMQSAAWPASVYN
jgi:hypothetical protein